MSEPAGDIRFETWPPVDRGGQHVGTTSGVKATHLQTGITAFVDIGRSQSRNREIAADMILSAITHPKFR